MEEIYRTYADTEITELSTWCKCPRCGIESLENGKSDCGETYIIECENCGVKYKMHFDAS